MNDLLERFFDLPPRQRAAAIVAAMLLVLFGYAYLFYWPRSEQIAKKESQLLSLKEERDKKAKLAANLTDARVAVAVLEGRLREAEAKLPKDKEIPDLLSQIAAAGSEAGLEMPQFRQRPQEYQDFYAEVPVDMVIRGGFSEVEEFFDRVGKLTRIVNVNGISMKSPPKLMGDPLRIDVSCRATTFRFLDEVERQRIAEQKKAKEGKGKRRGKKE